MKTNLESLDKKAVSQLTYLQIWTLNIFPGLSECLVKDKDGILQKSQNTEYQL